MSWRRLDDNYALDARVRAARAVSVWPYLISAMGRQAATLSDWDLDAAVLADGCQTTVEIAETAVKGLKRVGLLVRDGDKWTTPNWDRYQQDPSRSDRQDRYREANRARLADAEKKRRAATRGDAVATRGDDQRRVATPDMTGHDGTINNTVVPAEVVDGSSVRDHAEVGSRARETPARVEAAVEPEPSAPPVLDGPKAPLRQERPAPSSQAMPVCPSERDAQRKLKQILKCSPSQQERETVKEACWEYGAELVIEALDESGKSTQGPWTQRFFQVVLQRMARERRQAVEEREAPNRFAERRKKAEPEPFVPAGPEALAALDAVMALMNASS